MKVLAFDAFGTLLDVSRLSDSIARIMPNARKWVLSWREMQLEYSFLLALMDRYVPFSELTRRALETAAARQGRDLEEGAMTSLLAVWTQLPAYPDVAEALDTLRGRFRLAVLSNADPKLLAAALDHAGLAHYFERLLSADEVRTFKPSPRVYGLLSNRFGVPKEEIGLVSSNPFDVMGAKASGLRAIWVNRQGIPFDRLGFPPDLEVRDFADLLRRI